MGRLTEYHQRKADELATAIVRQIPRHFPQLSNRDLAAKCLELAVASEELGDHFGYFMARIWVEAYLLAAARLEARDA